MKYNKKIVLYLLFIITAQSTNYMSAGCGDDFWNTTKSFFCGLKPDAMGVKAVQETYKAADNILNDHLTETGEIVKDASSILGSEGAGKLADAIKESVEKVVPVLNVLAGFYALTKIWPISKEIAVGIRSLFWQSQEEKMHAIEVDDKHKQLVAKKAFRECLSKKTHTEKNSSGIPCACEETAQLYAMFAGIQNANDMKEAYKQYNTSSFAA